MGEAGEGSAPRMPPFPAGRLRTRPLPALLQLPLPHGHDSDSCALVPWSHMADGTCGTFSVGRNGISGDVGTSAAGWATVTGLSPQKQHREEGAWLALVLPAASGLGHHHTSWVLYSWPCRRCSGGSACPRGPTHSPSEVLMCGSPGGPPVLGRGFFVGRWVSQ